ncbi:MAG: hypothetical protein KUF72_17975 [Candidatus Thiodiazotropha sp. (ex Ctena orbiculata)]|nr:hypothetical protein [Candidatus Thiodiazotropha taylori]
MKNLHEFIRTRNVISPPNRDWYQSTPTPNGNFPSRSTLVHKIGVTYHNVDPSIAVGVDIAIQFNVGGAAQMETDYEIIPDKYWFAATSHPYQKEFAVLADSSFTFSFKSYRPDQTPNGLASINFRVCEGKIVYYKTPAYLIHGGFNPIGLNVEYSLDFDNKSSFKDWTPGSPIDIKLSTYEQIFPAGNPYFGFRLYPYRNW